MMKDGAQKTVEAAGASERFFSRKNMRPIMLAFLVAFFNQLSGCNAINYFAPRIFELAGFGRDSAFLATFGLGALNFASTFTGVWLIDRLGRKTLLVLGGVGYVVSLSLASVCFATGAGKLAVLSIFLFMAAHAVGQGTVIWVLIAEVFPQKFRAQGQALGGFTHWFFAALVSYCFPLFAGRADDPSTALVPTWAIFAFFLVMMVFHLFWALFVVPETKGKRLEDIRL
jgi:MFS family permease